MSGHNFECLLTGSVGDLDKKHFMRKVMGSQSRVVENRITSEEVENVWWKALLLYVVGNDPVGKREK